MEKLTYSPCGNYYIPDLTLSELPGKAIGKYGRMCLRYLKEYRPVLYNSLLFAEKLYPYLMEIDAAANTQLEQLMPELTR